jgi:hypothetical protein
VTRERRGATAPQSPLARVAVSTGGSSTLRSAPGRVCRRPGKSRRRDGRNPCTSPRSWMQPAPVASRPKALRGAKGRQTYADRLGRTPVSAHRASLAAIPRRLSSAPCVAADKGLDNTRVYADCEERSCEPVILVERAFADLKPNTGLRRSGFAALRECHEGELTTGGYTVIGAQGPVDLGALARELNRHAPPNTESTFLGDALGGNGWNVRMPDSSLEKVYFELPEGVDVESAGPLCGSG